MSLVVSSLLPEDGRRRSHIGYLSSGGLEFGVQILMPLEANQHVGGTCLRYTLYLFSLETG
jgi:hypothetical protein